MFDFQQIIHFLRKTFTKRDIVYLLLIVSAFLLTRLINIGKFPIFVDEGIYIRWAKVAWHDSSWRFISLTDGRQPLQTWMTIPFLKLFPHDLLVGGRLFGVFSGFISLVGIFTLFFYLINKKAAYLGAILYLFTPFFVFYDRLALVDSAVNAGFIWILFFSIYLVRSHRLDTALIFGMVSGFALLAKSTDRLFIMLSALAPLLYLGKNIRNFIQKTINYWLLFAIAGSIAILMYNIQRLSPYFQYVAMKNTTFIMTFPEFLKNPFAVFLHNIWTIPLYVLWELGWLTIVFSLIGGYFLYRKDKRLFFYLLLWLILPYIAIAFFARVLFPRYLIFLATLLVIFAIYFFSELPNIRLKSISFVVLLISFLILDSFILFKPTLISLPPIDRGQYIEGVTAVWGAQDLVSFAREKSKEKPVILLAEGNFGLVADVLDVFIKPTDKITLIGLWPLSEKEILDHQKDTKDHHVYIVFSHREEFPSNWPIQLVKKYPKPVGDKALYLFTYAE